MQRADSANGSLVARLLQSITQQLAANLAAGVGHEALNRPASGHLRYSCRALARAGHCQAFGALVLCRSPRGFSAENSDSQNVQGKERKRLESRYGSFVDKIRSCLLSDSVLQITSDPRCLTTRCLLPADRTRVNKVNREHAVRKADIVDVDAGFRHGAHDTHDRIKGRGWFGLPAS